MFQQALPCISCQAALYTACRPINTAQQGACLSPYAGHVHAACISMAPACLLGQRTPACSSAAVLQIPYCADCPADTELWCPLYYRFHEREAGHAGRPHGGLHVCLQYIHSDFTPLLSGRLYKVLQGETTLTMQGLRHQRPIPFDLKESCEIRTTMTSATLA